MTDGLTFNTLRNANQKRLADYGDCVDWTPNDWMVALVGEVGELANLMKKVRRGDFSQEEVQQHIRDELADIQAYVDLLSASLGVNLGRATINKFNAVSERIGSNIDIRDDGSDWKYREYDE